MLRFLNTCSKNRNSWLWLLIITIIFEASGLFIQHVLMKMPCVLCIYIRIALLGILIASLVALITPKQFIFRFVGIIIWIYASIEGLNTSISLVKMQLSSDLTLQCPIRVNLPDWLPLDEWFSFIFHPSGVCTDPIFHFLSLSFAQWMVIIFSVYLLVAVLVLISQPFKPKRQGWWR